MTKVLIVLNKGLPVSHALVTLPENVSEQEYKDTVLKALDEGCTVVLAEPAPVGLKVIITEDGHIVPSGSLTSTPCLVAGTFHKDSTGTPFLIQAAKRVDSVWSIKIESGQLKG